MRTLAQLMILALSALELCLAQSSTATIYVTGKLDGYVSSRNAQDFDRWFGNYKRSQFNSTPLGESAVLVGVGDNLALDYWSRFDGNGSPIHRVQQNPAEPDDPCRPAAGIANPPTTYSFPCTPAAYYLGQIAYTALVPGIRDFYFGAPLLYHLGNIPGGTGGGSILPMLGANLVLCDQKPDQTPPSPPPQPQILLPTQASLPSSVLMGNSSGSAGKGKSGTASGGGQASGAAGGAVSGGSSAMSAASAATAFGCDVTGSMGTTGGQVASSGVASIVYPSANSVYPWTTRLVLAVPEQFGPICDVSLQSSPGSANPNIPGRIAVVPLYAPRVSNSSIPCPSSSTAPCATPLRSPGSIPPDTRGLALYLVDLCQFDDVRFDGTVMSAKDPSKPTSAVLVPGAKLQLKVDLPFWNNGKDSIQSQLIPIMVQQPFFDHAWRCSPVNCIVSDGKPLYVVFGVVDPAIQSEISKTNLEADVYDGTNAPSPRQTLTVDFNDASSALIQAAQAFEVEAQKQSGTNSGNTSSTTTSTYIVLAQMTPDLATAFSRSLTYRRYTYGRPQHSWDLILSAADAYFHTPDGQQMFDSDTLNRIPVITPRPLLLPDHDHLGLSGDYQLLQLTNPIEKLTLARISGSTTIALALGHKESTTTSAPTDVECDSGDYTGKLSVDPGERIEGILKVHQLKSSGVVRLHMCEVATDFECLALVSMANKLDTDIALLQRRDLYTGCVLKDGQTMALGDREMIERMLPDTGLLTRVSISGGTLKSLLQQNDAIVSQSPLSTSPTAVDQDRSLIAFGITKGRPVGTNPIAYPKSSEPPNGDVDPHSTYYINGLPLDTTKIYSVATTDRLATAEPNFSQLSQQDLESPEIFPSHGKFTYRVAELVQDQLYPGTPQLQAKSPGAPPPSQPVIGSIASPKPPHPSVWGKVGNGFLKAWEEPIHDAASSNPIAGSLLPPGEYARQQRGYFAATLQQLSASYSFSHPNLSDEIIGNSFGGVTNPNVNSAHSDSAAAASNFRFIWNADRFFGLGGDEVVAYSRSRAGSMTQSPPALLNTGSPLPFSTSILSANSLVVSPFLQLQHFRSTPDWVPLAVRGFFNSDLARNEQFVKSTVKAGAAAETVYFILDPLRQQGYGFGLGSRLELSNLSYLEGGYLRQNTTNLLNGISIIGPSNSTVLPLTILGANQSVASILANTSTCGPTQPAPCLLNPGIGDQLVLQSKEVRQNGIYALGVLNAHLLDIRQLSSQTVLFGNAFFPGNVATRSSTETHYVANLTQSVQATFWSNLSFGPQYTLFLYGAQATSRPNTLTRQQLSLQLSYSFDWHSGLPRQAFAGQGK